MASPISPVIFICPPITAIIGLIAPSLSFSRTSAVRLIVQSASPLDALTVFVSPVPSIKIP